jgi:hypothetical protein
MIRREFAISADDYVVGDELTVFHFCMIYTDRYPGVSSQYPDVAGQRDRLLHLGAIAPLVPGPITVTLAGKDYEVDTREHYRIANAVYQELAKDLNTGRREPKKWAYLEDRPGEIDPTMCVLQAASLLDIAARRGDGGQIIRKLLAARRDPDLRKPGASPRSDEGPKTDHQSSHSGRRRGRVPNPIWSAAKNEAIQSLKDNGFPQPGDGGQAALEKLIADWLASWGHYPAESTVRRHVTSWINEYRAHVRLTS